MKLVSWNVNGLAACKRKGFLKSIARLRADIVCCQEVRTNCPLNTPEYLQYWNLAEQSGYSGTLILAKKEPRSVQYGFGIDQLDCEGRLIALEYDSFCIVNVYVPNSQSSDERLDYRIAWDQALLDFLDRLNKPAILCGDFNVARSYLDVYPENLRNEENPPGFLSDEREGMERLLTRGYVDVFRALHPEKTGAYTWWSNRLNKRLENRGWRLDYFLVSDALLPSVRSMEHHTDILGSDHCPISLTLQAAPPRKELSDEDMAVMWRAIDWGKMENQLLRVQQRLARAAYSGDSEAVTALQKQLVRSLPAKVLAVRHVVQINSAAGVDGVRWQTDAEKMRAALSLTSRGYHAKPYRRIIVSERGKERRIHVPAAYDKAMQALYAYSLDPVAESTADRKSFAFRKGRSMFDAHAYICAAFEGDNAPDWVVRADVKACYDTISHKWLLEHIPMDTKVLREFLRAGAVFAGELFPSEQGISMGATLSPILGNMTLDGLQRYLYEHLYPDGKIDYKNGNLIRYADDLIVSVRSLADGIAALNLLTDFLAERGLKLNMDKTGVFHLAVGFDFLSRHYERKDGVLMVRPSQKAVNDFEQRLSEFILNFHGSQKTLIQRLNRRLSGWGNYHRITDAYDAFRRIDTVVQSLLVKKMRQLHPKRQWEHIRKRYWFRTNQGEHIFAVQNKKSIQVLRLAALNFTEHKAIRTGFHPYLDQEYGLWLRCQRDDQKVSGPQRRSVWMRQAGRCYYCGRPMLPDQEVELVEIAPGKGRRLQNMAYIHKRCGYDVVKVQGEENGIDVLTLLEGATEFPQMEDPYYPLREFFRLCSRSPVTLTFSDIEEIIGDRLDWDAYFCEAWWFDEAAGMNSALWKLEFPFHAITPPEREYCISNAWISQGYRIMRLRLADRRVVFRRVAAGVSGLEIPKALTEQKLPDKAVYEAKDFFDYLIKKYAL